MRVENRPEARRSATALGVVGLVAILVGVAALALSAEAVDVGFASGLASEYTRKGLGKSHDDPPASGEIGTHGVYASVFAATAANSQGADSEIDGLVSEISASAQEQATGSQQVNTAVNQMDEVTQQNAAMVEQSTAANHSLAHEARALAMSVGRFRTSRAAPAAGRAPPLPTRAASRPAAYQPVARMRTVGRGGAAPKSQALNDNREEF